MVFKVLSNLNHSVVLSFSVQVPAAEGPTIAQFSWKQLKAPKDAPKIATRFQDLKTLTCPFCGLWGSLNCFGDPLVRTGFWIKFVERMGL